MKKEKGLDFGQWLYYLRKNKGYTEQELVDKIKLPGVQIKNIKKWE